jgi:hypothetical protein
MMHREARAGTTLAIVLRGPNDGVHFSATNKLPTDSLTFDADHASLALRHADIFVTQDLNLAEVSDKIAEGLKASIGWRCAVVGDPDALRVALASVKARGQG